MYVTKLQSLINLFADKADFMSPYWSEINYLNNDRAPSISLRVPEDSVV